MTCSQLFDRTALGSCMRHKPRQNLIQGDSLNFVTDSMEYHLITRCAKDAINSAIVIGQNMLRSLTLFLQKRGAHSTFRNFDVARCYNC